MKKLILLIVLLLVTRQGYAQYKFGFNIGANLPYTTHLNHYLVQANLQPLEGMGLVAGLNLALGNDELTNRMDFNYFLQQGKNNTDKSTSLQGFYYTVNIGYKVINRYKYSLEPMLGVSLSSGCKLNIRNGTPVSSTLSTQLTSPNSTITSLTYRAPFFFHAGLQYKFKVKAYSLGIRAGHHVRLSKGKWFSATPSALLQDAPTLNPLGTYINFMLFF
jgi:hypothetical protein